MYTWGDIVVWKEIIVSYRLVSGMLGVSIDRELRPATKEEVILYKKYQ